MELPHCLIFCVREKNKCDIDLNLFNVYIYIKEVIQFDNHVQIIQPTSSFTYATIQNSAFTQMFHDSKDPNWNRMYYFMKDYNFRSTEKAFERLKAGYVR